MPPPDAPTTPHTHASPLFGMRRPFISEMTPPPELSGAAWWFGFHRNLLLLQKTDGQNGQKEGGTLAVPYLERFEDLGVEAGTRHYLGRYDGRACHAVDLPDAAVPDGLALQDLRQAHAGIPEDLFVLGGRAVQILEWDRTHRYCGRCGAENEAKPDERAKQCPQCKLLSFPRLSPAIIVMVEREGQILLARSPHFPPRMFSVLAGFVEPGETVEECVAREVGEEVGIRVADIRYFASQPWPFPHSLMLGFTAAYAGGEIEVDGVEIEQAAWFHPDALPTIPGRLSISRRLIDHFVATHRASHR